MPLTVEKRVQAAFEFKTSEHFGFFYAKMREAAFRKVLCRGEDDIPDSTPITRTRATGICLVSDASKSLKMGQVRQCRPRRTRSGLLLALMLLVIGPSTCRAEELQDKSDLVGEVQKFSRSNFTQKFSDKVQISKDTFVSVEEALQLLKSRNKVPHIKFGPKLEKVQLIGSGLSENKSPQLTSGRKKHLERRHRPSHEAQNSAKNFPDGFLKSLGGGAKSMAGNGEADRVGRKVSDLNYADKDGHSDVGYVTIDAKTNIKNMPQFIGDSAGNYGDASYGGDVEGLEIQTESPPSRTSGSTYRDCPMFAGNELVGVHAHGTSWSEGDDRCAVCQCDDGEQRCYYHYCNGPELGFITPPSAETPSAQDEADGNSKGPQDKTNGSLDLESSAGEASNRTASSETPQRHKSSVKPSTTSTMNETIERLLAFDDDDYEYDLQSSGMPPWYYSDDEDGYFEDYDQDDYSDRHDNYDSSLDLLPDVDTIHRHDYGLPNRPVYGSATGGVTLEGSEGSKDCESDCGRSCPYGYKITPGEGCPTCKCLKCRPLVDCMLYCSAGYKSDSHGCPTCTCAVDLQEDNHKNPELYHEQPPQPHSGQHHTYHHLVNQDDTQPEFNHNPATNVDVEHTLGDITATRKFDVSFAGENNDVIDHQAELPVDSEHLHRNYKTEQNLQNERHALSSVETAVDKKSSFVEIDEHFQHGVSSPDVGEKKLDVANIPVENEHVTVGDVAHLKDDVETNGIHVDLPDDREKTKHVNGKKNKEQDPHNHFYDNAFNILKEDEVSILRDENPEENRDFHIESLSLTPDDANDIFMKKGNEEENDFDDEDDSVTTYSTHHGKYSKDAIPRSSHDMFAPVNYDLDFVTSEDDIMTTVARDEIGKHDKKTSNAVVHDKRNCSHTPPHHCQDPSGTRYPAGAVWYRGACTVCRCYGAGYAECTITQCSTAPAPAHCAPPVPGQCCPRCFDVPGSDQAVLQTSVTAAEIDNGPSNESSNGPSNAVSNGLGSDSTYDNDSAPDNSTVKEAVRRDISSICVVVLVLVAVTSVGVVVALRYWRRYHSAKYDIAATLTCEEAQKLRPVKLSSSEQISDTADVLEPLRPAKCV